MEDAAIIALYNARSETAIAETEKKYGSYCRTIAYRIPNVPDRNDRVEGAERDGAGYIDDRKDPGPPLFAEIRDPLKI